MLCSDNIKSKGQSLSKVRWYLLGPVFTHGQLYLVVKTKE